jgi:hypothetical protein
MLSNFQAQFLSQAIQKILKNATEGSMAYIRCLPSEVIRELCNHSSFIISDWKVYGVFDENDANTD